MAKVHVKPCFLQSIHHGLLSDPEIEIAREPRMEGKADDHIPRAKINPVEVSPFILAGVPQGPGLIPPDSPSTFPLEEPWEGADGLSFPHARQGRPGRRGAAQRARCAPHGAELG